MKPKPAFTIQHAIRFANGHIAPNAVSTFGAFTTRRDAERWLEDNPNVPNPVIFPTTANATTDWGADCPKCNTRAERATDLGYTGTIALWWRCPKCRHPFTH
jgi:L-aminopeptidase/D-esterase-like protein